MKRFLDRLGTLGDLGAADIAAVSGAFVDVADVRANADLVRAGEGAVMLHVLVEGWACRYVLLADGRRKITALFLPGDLCDLDVLTADRLDYGIVAVVPCRVARLSPPALSSALDRHPAIARALLALASEEKAILARWHVALGRQLAREHIAHFLCELVVRLGDGNGPDVAKRHPLPLTQTELADLFGLTTVHVNRVLQGLRRDGLIELSRERLRVLDWAGLVAVAGFDARYLGRAASPRPRPATGPRAAEAPFAQPLPHPGRDLPA